jgi:hypothetical protein
MHWLICPSLKHIAGFELNRPTSWERATAAFKVKALHTCASNSVPVR